MFATPRLKKSALPPPSKKRKTVHSVEEIAFDNNARAEYLTGFHKRKLLRQKQGQEIAAEKARKEKIEMRRQLKEERKQALEEHVQTVNQIFKEAMRAGQDDEANSEHNNEKAEWNGFEDKPPLEPVDHDEEYIDEDRYTTVTVESVTVDRDGLHKPVYSDEDEDAEDTKAKSEEKQPDSKKARPKTKKKKFTYETKFERKLTERKQRAKKRR